MHVELVPAVIPAPMGGGRTPGVHVSRIIGAIAKKNGILKPDQVEEMGLVEATGDSSAWWDGLNTESKLRIAIGLAWEDWYLAQLPDVIKHPGELCVDGVFMTPDGESLDVIVSERHSRYTLATHEVKATYKSPKTVADLNSQWMWLAQTRAYRKGVETVYPTSTTDHIVYLHVLFLCGDYKYPISPSLGPFRDAPSIWRIEYTQAEIDENWNTLMEYLHYSMEAEISAAIRSDLMDEGIL